MNRDRLLVFSIILALLAAVAEASPRNSVGRSLCVNERGHLAWRDTGERFVIVEANSPENRFATDDEGLLFAWSAMGANTLYFTTLGGDDPAATLTEANLEEWRGLAAYWCMLGPDRVLHVLISERETAHRVTADHVRRVLRLVDGLPAILCLAEEVPDSLGYGWIRQWSEFVHAEGEALFGYRPVVSVHNELHWRPWDRFVGDGIVDLIAFQGTLGQARQELPEWHRLGLESGQPWAIYSSELVDGIAPGEDELAVAFFFAGGRDTSGGGVYAGYGGPCGDLACPDPTPYASVFAALAASARVLAAGGDVRAAALLGIAAPIAAGSDGVADAADCLP